MSLFLWTFDVPCCEVLAICFVSIFCLLVHWHLKGKEHKVLPPGPFPWPIIGNALQLGSNLHLDIDSMRKTYGDIFQIKVLSRSVVVVSGKTPVAECLHAQSVAFSARPEFVTSQCVLQGKSLTFSRMDVATHKQYRHLALCALREVTRAESPLISNNTNADYNTAGDCEVKIPFVEQLLLDEGKKMGDRLVELSELHEKDTEALTSAVRNEILTTVCNINASVLFGKR